LGILVFSPHTILAASASPDRIVVQNNRVCFELEPVHFGLIGLTDVETGINHMQPANSDSLLWEIHFCRGDEVQKLPSEQLLEDIREIKNLPDRYDEYPIHPVTVTSLDVSGRDYHINKSENGGMQATFSWDGIDLPEEKNVVTVQVTLDLPAGSGIGLWWIRVTNDSKQYGVWDTEFPRLGGFLKSGEYDIAFPGFNQGNGATWGHLTKNCSDELTGEYLYPSMPMQFFCASKGDSSVYVATHDPKAWFKRFGIHPGKKLWISTIAENTGLPGTGYTAPFPVALGIYRGGWMEGCKIYRTFAQTVPWMKEGKLSQRESVPQNFKDVGLWMRVNEYIGPADGTIEQKNKPLLDAQKYFGVPLAAHWYQWHEIPFDVHYPNYFPTKPGIPEQARDLVSHGILTMPYINGRIVDISNSDFIRDYLPYAAKDRQGRPFIETYAVPSAVMCPYTEFWQDKVTEIVRRIVDEVGVDSVYIDQISAEGPKLCFDPSHGHPLGGGSWWVEGYEKMLEKIQQVCHREGRNVSITSELPVEAYLNGLDGYLVWLLHQGREIPMLTSVYSGYTLYFGSRARFENGDLSWIFVQGRTFLWGSQCGWMGLEIFQKEHEKKADFLKQAGQYRVACRNYLTYGELVDTFDSPELTKADGQANITEFPVVQGTLWKAESNSLAVLMVNYLDQVKNIEFTIRPAKYGLSDVKGFKIRPIRPVPVDEVRLEDSDQIQLKETLQAQEIRALEISSR